MQDNVFILWYLLRSNYKIPFKQNKTFLLNTKTKCGNALHIFYLLALTFFNELQQLQRL